MKKCFIFWLLSAVLFSAFAEEERIVKCDNCPTLPWLIIKPTSYAEQISPSANRAKIITTYAIVKRLSSVEKKYGDAPAIEAALSGQSKILKRKVEFHKSVLQPKKTVTDYFLKLENCGVVEKTTKKENFSYEILFFLLGILFVGIITGVTPYYRKTWGENTIITTFLLAALCFGSILFFYQAEKIVTWNIAIKIPVFTFLWIACSVLSVFIMSIFAALWISIKEKLLKNHNFLAYLSGLFLIIMFLSIAALSVSFAVGNYLYWFSKIFIIGGLATIFSAIAYWLIDFLQNRQKIA